MERIQSASVGRTVITGEGIVIGCGAGLIRSTAATRITTTMIPPMMRYGIRDLFSFITTRQFGQTDRLELHRCAAVGTGFLRHLFQLFNS